MEKRKEEIYREIDRLKDPAIEVEPEFFINRCEGMIKIYTHHPDDLTAVKEFIKARYKTRIDAVLNDSKEKIKILEQELKTLI